MPRVHGLDRTNNGPSNSHNTLPKINPLPHSVLETKEFSSKSFSVGMVTDKIDVGGNNVGTDTRQEDSIGLAPSLKTINPHAAWLYRRSQRAIATMESGSPLELSTKILNTLHHHNGEEKEDTTNLQTSLFALIKGGKKTDLNLVFEVCERRDELRGDGVESGLKAIAARENERMDVVDDNGWDGFGVGDFFIDRVGVRGAVQQPAAAETDLHARNKSTEAVEKAMDNLKMDIPQASPTQTKKQSDTITDPLKHTPDGLETLRKPLGDANIQPTAATWKKPRSRHKKRKDVSHSAECDPHQPDSKITLKSPHDNQAPEPLKTEADFPIQNDGLEIKDDNQWVFNPTEEQLLEIQQLEASPERRITRSMGSVDDGFKENGGGDGVGSSVGKDVGTAASVALSNNGKQASPAAKYAEKASACPPAEENAQTAESVASSNSVQQTSVCSPAKESVASEQKSAGTPSYGSKCSPKTPKMASTPSPSRSKPRAVVFDQLESTETGSFTERDNTTNLNSVPEKPEATTSIAKSSPQQSPKITKLKARSSPRKHPRSPAKQLVESEQKSVGSPSPSCRSMCSPMPSPSRSKPRAVLFDQLESRYVGSVTEKDNTSNSNSVPDKPESTTPTTKSSPQKSPDNSKLTKPKVRSSPRKHPSPNEPDEVKSNSTSSPRHSRPRRRRSEKRGPIRVMFTGFNPTQRHREMIHSLGAELVENVEDAATATHIIVSDGKTKLRRTPKLMICLSRVSKILTIEWLVQSSRQQQLLDEEDFLHVQDKEAEKRYNFCMSDSIKNGIRVRRERGGVLGGMGLHICRGVAGNQAPSMRELQLIIEAAGGAVLNSISGKDFDPTKTIIITSDPRTQSQINEHGVKELMAKGARAYTTSWLFHTIVTQNFAGIDNDHTSNSNKTTHVSSLVRCGSNESLVSTLTTSPPKHSGRKRDSHRAHNPSVCSESEYGSASSSSRRKRRRKDSKVETEEIHMSTSHQCKGYLSRDQFMSDFSPLTEPFTEDEAAIKTYSLWANYRKEFGSSSSTTPKIRRGVRCRRGRRRTLSPLISCALSADAHAPQVVPCSQKKAHSKSHQTPTSSPLPQDHKHVSWEAYVLYTLGIRADLYENHDPTVDSYFPKPVSIGHYKNKLALNVDTTETNGSRKEDVEVFGTLQDSFDLHKKFQFGPIPESVLASLAILAIEAVSAMHFCGVAHNDLALDSFLIARAHSSSDSDDETWQLQIVGFGYKSLVLNCQDECSCRRNHFEHDYKCLANIIHMLLTGGMPITLNEVLGQMEFASKAFLKGNLFIRGALSWCALIDALMCTGDDFELNPIQLQYPLDIFKVEACDGYPKCRTNQIIWACRMLREISSTHISLSTFLEGLLRYNYRFVLPNATPATFSCHVDNTRQSFLLCSPLAPATKLSSTNIDTACIHNLQNRLAEKERNLAHREAFYTNESEIESKIRESTLKAEKSIQQKQNDLLRREEGIAAELQHIKQMKEELLARERWFEQRMQQVASENDSPSKTESVFDSPCQSTHCGSSVCSDEDIAYIPSSGGKKRKKRRKDSLSGKQHEHVNLSPGHNSRNTHYHAPRPSEHLCSLQNLDSPTLKNRRASLTKIRRNLHKSPKDSPGKPRRTPKKMFLDMSTED